MAAICRSMTASRPRPAALFDRQQADGHFVFELEGRRHHPRPSMCCCANYLAEPIDTPLEEKIAAYLRRIQAPHGGWPAPYRDGEFEHEAPA